MSEMPTPKQRLILWCLLGRQGRAVQSAIVPKVEKADREALIAGKLLTSEKQGRSILLTVTDRGWNWAGTHLRDPLPKTFQVLQDWLERIDRHLAVTGGTLAELIGPPPAAPTPAATKRPRAKTPPTAARKRAAGPAIRERLETAYLALTGGERARAVRLSALRAHLSDLDRAAVDAGLRAILRGDATARLSQLTDPKALDAAERAAAYSPAGEPFHLLWIEA